MEELVHYLERTPKNQRSQKWKQIVQLLPPPLSEALRPNEWKKIYSMKSINSALSKVRMVGFNEKIVSEHEIHFNSGLLRKRGFSFRISVGL
jgi:integrator complex subunit 9